MVDKKKVLAEEPLAKFGDRYFARAKFCKRL